jgi:bacteriorhodopsin
MKGIPALFIMLFNLLVVIWVDLRIVWLTGLRALPLSAKMKADIDSRINDLKMSRTL